jgi:hypothetical protein
MDGTRLYGHRRVTSCKSLRDVVVAAVTLGALVAPAGAQERKQADVTAASPNAIQLACFKQYGATQNPQTGMWTMTGPPYALEGAVDAIYGCVAQRTGKPAAPFLHVNFNYR